MLDVNFQQETASPYLDDHFGRLIELHVSTREFGLVDVVVDGFSLGLAEIQHKSAAAVLLGCCPQGRDVVLCERGGGELNGPARQYGHGRLLFEWPWLLATGSRARICCCFGVVG